MPHGTPDWGHIGPKTTTFGLDDMGELAVRLGSIHLWDRRGDTITLDNFEAGLGQAGQVTGGLGAAIALEGGHSMLGAFSVKLTPGSDGIQLAGLRYRRGTPYASRVGLEFSFTLAAQTQYWRWNFAHWTGARVRTGGVRYDHQASTLEYDDGTPGWAILSLNMALFQDPRCWHTGKLVVDLGAVQYVRFILDDLEWRMTPYPLVDGPSFIAPGWYSEIWHISTAGNNPSAYVDAVVITQNEP